MSVNGPTLQSAAWAMTGFFDAACELLRTERAATELRLYFYAVTAAGWGELSPGVASWRRAGSRRVVTAYVGTDHGLTDAVALDRMRLEGVQVRMLRRYKGVYHPKVVWFVEGTRGHLLVGSNNLTFNGLKKNIEFATITKLAATDANLVGWHDAIHKASDPLTASLLASYRREREAFGKARAKANVAATFTWSKRSSSPSAGPRDGVESSTRPTPKRRAPAGGVGAEDPASVGELGVPRGADLIVEIMPMETGTGGSQIQIPMTAARAFFGLGDGKGARKTIALRNAATMDQRQLTMTRFGNVTARLVVKELDYRDRPCLILFRRTVGGVVEFEIVRRAIDPDRYGSLLRLCGPPTKKTSKRWILVPAR